MNPADFPTAWDHPPTRRAWNLLVFKDVAGLIGWIGVWIALLGISLETPDWAVWIFMPYWIYSPWRMLVQSSYIPTALRMRRILQNYPWQLLRDVPNGLTKRPEIQGNQFGWFEFPNPARPEQQLPLVFAKHPRVTWWHRRMAPRAKPQLEAQIATVWFAGDPRMIGLIAAPAPSGASPRRMMILSQRLGKGHDIAYSDWGVSPSDLEQARRAGFVPAADPLRKRETPR
ncbi:hypothetical protein DMA15_17190 [Streptomyces sp. WAC 01529]|uniref:hypothetical protein n=1 Tax=Streptomyces sp. WAC 01529 TaxID=2203205 RepID=UPI000F6CC790|nr:hypothetical protein [Streptomyces sp. WAC 01529]AZM54092.1 hypothetical protein DMA15_17190 [Streptomyces sp. WAC 01529]